MKKITLIFLIVFGLSVFNITQASAGCNIVWTGRNYYDGSGEAVNGSIPTNETSRTQQAALELFNAIPRYHDSSLSCDCFIFFETPSFINNCYSISRTATCASGISICISGSWRVSCTVDNIRPDACDLLGGCTYYTGTWDVICDSSTTTTIQPTTTTTTPATLIELSSFTVTPRAGKVILQWNTESETDNAGFNLYRSETEDGEYIKINLDLISANGTSTEGASYEYVDTGLKNRKTHYYKLEDIDLNGQSTMHGPVSATPRWLLGIFSIFRK